METNKLAGKKVVILGGTSGFGLATAKAAAAAGADVTIASRDRQNVENALKELPAGTRGAPVDVLDEDALNAFYTKVGDFDHLVVTAGDTIPAFDPNLTQGASGV
jgi:NAD(P)-dependent dehydrogenase (short-subunit alcohol dehydrogenase family)